MAINSGVNSGFSKRLPSGEHVKSPWGRHLFLRISNNIKYLLKAHHSPYQNKTISFKHNQGISVVSFLKIVVYGDGEKAGITL